MALCWAVMLSLPAAAQSGADNGELDKLTSEREILTHELQQYQTTVALLLASDSARRDSAATIENLSSAVIVIKRRLIAITTAEVALLQRQIAIAAGNPGRYGQRKLTVEEEREQVARLLALIARYYSELSDIMATQPGAEELAARQEALDQASSLDRRAYDPQQVLLSGAQGSAYLAHISERLMDPRIPESRRDVTPLFALKTRLYGALIASETRSLRPAGKQHYLARVRLQPGDTTFSIENQRWKIRLPDADNASDFLVVLYRPVDDSAQLHVFSVNALLALEAAHIPPWLPAELQLSSPQQ